MDEDDSDIDPSDSEDSNSELSLPRTEPELKARINAIKSATTNLNRLSATIRRTIGTDWALKANGIDVSFYEKSDREHFNHSFPNAPAWLIERLVQATAVRRKVLFYLVKQNEKKKEDQAKKIGKKAPEAFIGFHQNST